ncbi:hypothetical protein ACLOJK_015808 [Asimina triloba]
MMEGIALGATKWQADVAPLSGCMKEERVNPRRLASGSMIGLKRDQGLEFTLLRLEDQLWLGKRGSGLAVARLHHLSLIEVTL